MIWESIFLAAYTAVNAKLAELYEAAHFLAAYTAVNSRIWRQ